MPRLRQVLCLRQWRMIMHWPLPHRSIDSQLLQWLDLCVASTLFIKWRVHSGHEPNYSKNITPERAWMPSSGAPCIFRTAEKLFGKVTIRDQSSNRQKHQFLLKAIDPRQVVELCWHWFFKEIPTTLKTVLSYWLLYDSSVWVINRPLASR